MNQQIRTVSESRNQFVELVVAECKSPACSITQTQKICCRFFIRYHSRSQVPQYHPLPKDVVIWWGHLVIQQGIEYSDQWRVYLCSRLRWSESSVKVYMCGVFLSSHFNMGTHHTSWDNIQADWKTWSSCQQCTFWYRKSTSLPMYSPLERINLKMILWET